MSKTTNKTELERRAKNYDFAAPVTSTASIAETIVVGFGDGSVRFFQAGHEPRLIQAHAVSYTHLTLPTNREV